MSDASNFVETIQSRQGLRIACLEEIALNNGWLEKEVLLRNLNIDNKSEYAEYLRNLVGVRDV